MVTPAESVISCVHWLHQILIATVIPPFYSKAGLKCGLICRHSQSVISPIDKLPENMLDGET